MNFLSWNGTVVRCDNPEISSGAVIIVPGFSESLLQPFSDRAPDTKSHRCSRFNGDEESPEDTTASFLSPSRGHTEEPGADGIQEEFLGYVWLFRLYLTLAGWRLLLM